MTHQDGRPLDVDRSGAEEGETVQVTRLSDVQETALEWLWPNVYPIGKLSLLAGDPGLGKTFISLDLIARVTRGASFPHSEEPALPGSAVILSAEDDLADTLVPRLRAAGADLGRVVTFKVRQGVESFGLPTLASIRETESVLDGVDNPRLVVIDPVSAFIGSVNDHRNAELRGLLAPLAEMAARRRVSIIMVTHLSKGAGGKAVYRATGSLAYAAAARACWLVAKAPDDPGRRLFLPFKCNLSIDPTGLTYSLAEMRVEWDEPTTIDADSILAAEVSKPSKPAAADRAAEWLSQALAGGPRPSEEIFEEGRTLFDFKRDTLFKAKERLGIRARKTDFSGGWVWELPPEASKSRSVGNDGDCLRLRDGHAVPSARIGRARLSRSFDPSDASTLRSSLGRAERRDPVRLSILLAENRSINRMIDMELRMSLSDEIREAVDASGMSRYRIAKELDIAESTMSRFMSRKGGLTMKVLDRLADLMDLHVVAGPKCGGEG